MAGTNKPAQKFERVAAGVGDAARFAATSA